ncbi:zinc finger protein 37-like [Cydia pomonella]|uniref:zinc finger protein 37-like n=1 Tax=Cydia pomonella TaxID=82600 RepID=UPI002ADD3E4D|nr:zinc finger protein 37-like [Cydia pomonella]
MSADAPKKLFFYELCRLCLENAGATDVFESGEFLEDIFACTGVKLAHADNLPHKVCTQCLAIVKSSKELRILAMKNDAHLRTLFGDVDSDTETVILEPCTRITTHDTPSKAGSETSERCKYQSSKEKLSFLLQEGEEENNPKKRTKTKSPEKILKVKVEEENRCKRIKLEDNETDTLYCNECDKSFHTKKKLYLHQRLHNKKIICPLDACGKKFATKGDMQKHIRTHTGEKPYKCKMCNKSFAQRVSLRQHMSSLHSPDETSNDGD